MQGPEKLKLSQFNGDYNILSIDSNSNTLDHTFTGKSFFDLNKLPGKNDYIKLSAISDTHLKATLFIDNKIIKSRIVKGTLNNNYFEFHKTHLSLKYIFILYGQQTNRLLLSKEGNLYLDTNRGGIDFLLILPVPLSGSSNDACNLMFKRKG